MDTASRIIFSVISLAGLTIGILVIIAKLNKIEKEIQKLHDEVVTRE